MRRRLVFAATGGLMAVGLSVGAAASAQATTFYNVTSNWWQAFASLTSTGGDGYFQAYAYLGNTTSWGAYSEYNTHAQVDGFDFTHNAFLYRNGAVWQQAQQ